MVSVVKWSDSETEIAVVVEVSYSVIVKLGELAFRGQKDMDFRNLRRNSRLTSLCMLNNTSQSNI